MILVALLVILKCKDQTKTLGLSKKIFLKLAKKVKEMLKIFYILNKLTNPFTTMRSLNQDFKYPKSLQLFIGFVFAVFFMLFILTISAVVGAIDTELDSATIASIEAQGNF
jgi:hypothetical protein